MAEDDIYGNKGRYIRFKSNLDLLLRPPGKKRNKSKYHCKNPDNLKYFRQMFLYFEAKDLSYVRRLRILQTLKFVAYATRKELKKALTEVISDKESDIVLKQLISLYTLLRQRSISVGKLMEGLQYGISAAEKPWSEEEISRWQSIRPQLEDLLSLPAVWNVVKALDLSYDYANLFQNAKILVDIRPIFNKDATNIQGAVISYTLRLYFDSLEGSKNLSIALDKTDVSELMESCKRALKKADCAQKLMQEWGVKKILIAGNEEEGL